MSEIAAALTGSIEPARGGGPKPDHGVNPLTLILFFGVLAADLARCKTAGGIRQ